MTILFLEVKVKLDQYVYRFIYHTILMIEMVNIPYQYDIVSLPSPSSVRYGMVTTLITCVVRSPASY